MAVFKIQTLNSIAVTGLDRFPRDRYEVASELNKPDAITPLIQMHDMQYGQPVVRRTRRRRHEQHPVAKQAARRPGVQHAGRAGRREGGS
jgi:hypothetical protein